MSLLAAVGNLGVHAIIINAGSLRELLEMLPSSPQILFLCLAGLLSSIITVLLLAPMTISKQTQLAMFLASVAVLALAAVQTSISLLFVLLWPWSLYKLYRSDAA